MKNLDRILLKNSVRLLIGGYLYDTTLADKSDEYDKLLEIPETLNELAADYKRELEAFEEHIDLVNSD